MKTSPVKQLLITPKKNKYPKQINISTSMNCRILVETDTIRTSLGNFRQKLGNNRGDLIGLTTEVLILYICILLCTY